MDTNTKAKIEFVIKKLEFWTKILDEVQVTNNTQVTEKKKPGRPKGSKNKPGAQKTGRKPQVTSTQANSNAKPMTFFEFCKSNGLPRNSASIKLYNQTK